MGRTTLTRSNIHHYTSPTHTHTPHAALALAPLHPHTTHTYTSHPACRYDGWVTELADAARVKDLRSPAGIDNLLYSADTYFSCFADLALTSPVDYFKEGKGSLMQVCVCHVGNGCIF